MKIAMDHIWKQNPDLNFGEIREVIAAAERAADEAANSIRRAKIKAAARSGAVWCPIPRNCYP